jgi:peptide/nickel transport system permease protein
MSYQRPLNRIRSLRKNNLIVRNTVGGIQRLLSRNITRIPLLFLTLVVVLAVFGESIAPYGYNERLIAPDGGIMLAEPPSVAHPLGTTGDGYDVLSRIIVGARPTAIAGVVGGTMIVSIGLTVALLSGYLGGVVDETLMRVTDLFFAIPFIPFALVVVAFFGAGFWIAIFIIGILLWRSNARVIRAQVLQIKERPYIQASKASGASSRRIILKHILPNVAPMAILYFALGIGVAIIAQASLAFVGVADAQTPSWGVMIRNAYFSGYLRQAWAWALVPGFMIAFTVLSTYLIGRSFESADQATGGV